jgi:hypothetical protein
MFDYHQIIGSWALFMFFKTFSFEYGSLNLEPCTCQSGALPLKSCPQPFLLWCFLSRVLDFSWDNLDHNLPLYASFIARMTGIGWDGVLLAFCLDWLWTVILLISTCLVITAKSVSHLPSQNIFIYFQDSL